MANMMTTTPPTKPTPTTIRRRQSFNLYHLLSCISILIFIIATMVMHFHIDGKRFMFAGLISSSSSSSSLLQQSWQQLKISRLKYHHIIYEKSKDSIKSIYDNHISKSSISNWLIYYFHFISKTMKLWNHHIHSISKFLSQFYYNRCGYPLRKKKWKENRNNNNMKMKNSFTTTATTNRNTGGTNTANNRIQMYDERIGRACDPNYFDDKNEDGGGEDVNDNDSENGNENQNHRPYSGMVLQIYPHQYNLENIQIFGQNSILDANTDDDTSIEVRSRSSSGGSSSGSSVIHSGSTPTSTSLSTYHNYHLPCKEATSGMKDQIDVNEYLLLEVMYDSLGHVDFHNQDYAYRPVNMLLGSSSTSSSTNSNDNGDNSKNWIWEESGSESDYIRMGKRAFAGGSHGEVWKARKRCNQVVNVNYHEQQHKYQKPKEATSCDDRKELILKRIKIGKDSTLMETGLREVYFGDILSRSDESSTLFTIYVDHFFLNHSYSNESSELWIVFENAGPSLRSYIYTAVTSGDFVIYQHSPLWRQLRMEVASRMKTSKSSSSVSEVAIVSPAVTIIEPDSDSTSNIRLEKTLDWKSNTHKREHSKLRGKVSDLLKEILMQVLRSAAKLHERGIVHRDIKPSNIMCRTGSDLNEFGANCVLGDFSSAFDEFSSQHFYSKGPSAAEQTNEYAPPEALFAKEWIPFYKAKPESYDSWSIGVLILELLLGTPNVFSVDQRTTTLLTNKMNKEGASEEDIQRALYLAALSQFCIYVPTNESDKNWPLREGDPLFKASIVKTTCTIHDFQNALRARDPLGIGFDKSIDPLLQLVWGLLAWDPKDRLTASEAMEHFYFSDKGYDTDGEHNALEPQMLDPRLDMAIEKQKVDSFVCPKCGRKFEDLNSCQAHATGRRHSKFCSYDRSRLPPCLNAHSMLPSHPTSGYCDIQGRRRVIEDFHTVHLEKDHQFFGVFDGHNGNLASKYAASELYKQFVMRLKDVDKNIKKDVGWKKDVEDEMTESFEELHRGVLDVIQSYPTGGVMKKSGTTATALFVTEYAVIVASVGDSRAVLSVGTSFDSTKQASSIQLTFDHVASNTDERKRIEKLGGKISSVGGVLRVNGTLVLSRSIGDAHLAQYLSRTPNVVTMTKQEVKDKCKVEGRLEGDREQDYDQDGPEMPCFIILASDGLWDVLSNQQAVDLVEQVIQKYDSTSGKGWEEDGGAFQEAAEVLTQEAFVRGSTDNIGVCVVAIT